MRAACAGYEAASVRSTRASGEAEVGAPAGAALQPRGALPAAAASAIARTGAQIKRGLTIMTWRSAAPRPAGHVGEIRIKRPELSVVRPRSGVCRVCTGSADLAISTGEGGLFVAFFFLRRWVVEARSGSLISISKGRRERRRGDPEFHAKAQGRRKDAIGGSRRESERDGALLEQACCAVRREGDLARASSARRRGSAVFSATGAALRRVELAGAASLSRCLSKR